MEVSWLYFIFFKVDFNISSNFFIITAMDHMVGPSGLLCAHNGHKKGAKMVSADTIFSLFSNILA